MAAYEVEVKFPLKRAADQFAALLIDLGAVADQDVEQADIYFSHPTRDFRETDEALRIRSVGEQNIITYKGPLLDAQTKTRQEIEVPCAAGANIGEQLWAMLRALGFRDVRRVHKRRQTYRLTWHDQEVKIAVDDVTGLGMYVELETLATQADWEEARDHLLQLAAELDLQDSERRSYLRMLVERDSISDDGGSQI